MAFKDGTKQCDSQTATVASSENHADPQGKNLKTTS
jgi:hypothetical protein